MILGGRFLKLVAVAFVIYALVKNKVLPISFEEQKDPPKFEFLHNAKAAIEVLTAEPPHRKNTQRKDGPLLNVDYDPEKTKEESIKKTNETNTNKIKPAQRREESNLVNIKDSDLVEDEDQINSKTWLEQKLMNATDNLLHTPQGQELLEKFLLNRENLPNNPNQVTKLKDPHHNNSTMDLEPGEGIAVKCGDLVTANYITRLVNGQEIENTYYHDTPLTFQVGNHQVIKGLEYATLGMKAGGRRRLVVPPKMGYKEAKHSKGMVKGNEFITVDVELISINPEYQKLDNDIRIFEDATTNSPVVMCSDMIYFKYKLSKLDNSVIAQSVDKYVGFILGSEQVPPAINRAFTNLHTRSKRTVILPSSAIFNKSTTFLPKNITIPKNELIVLEIDTN